MGVSLACTAQGLQVAYAVPVKEETGLQRCFCLNLLSLFARKYGNISFVGNCLYPIEQKATSIIMLLQFSNQEQLAILRMGTGQV